MFLDQIAATNEKFPTALFPNDGWKEEESRRSQAFEPISSFNSITLQIKKLIRMGIPIDQRSKWWMIESGGAQLKNDTICYWKDIKAKTKKMKEQDSPFGVHPTFLNAIPEKRRCKIHKFIQLVYHQNRHVDYSPVLPRVCSLLLGFLKPCDAYATVQALINRSAEDHWYFSLTRDQFMMSVSSIKDLCYIRFRSLIQHFDEIGIQIEELFIEFMFSTSISLPNLLTILDAFLYEGKKILIRYFIQFLSNEKNVLIRTKDANSVLDIFSKFADKIRDINYFHKYIHDAYSLQISRGRHIIPAENIAKHRSIGSLPKYTKSLEDLIANRHNSMAVPNEDNLKGSQFLDGQSVIISAEDFDTIHSFFPPLIKNSQLRLDFRMTVDGTSFKSLLASATPNSPILLLIETEGRKCGAFLSDSPEKREKLGRYFGRSSTFVFELEPAIVYKKTKKTNNLFISIDENEMMIGGPTPAIYLMEGLATLQSGNCETFDSLAFATEDGDMITNIEVFSFLSLAYK